MRAAYSANPGAAESFRWAFGTSPKGIGLSPQTEPKQFRYRYVPPPGRIFVNPDLDQVEARYVAYRSRCQNMIEIFTTPGRHIHKETGEWMYGHKVEKTNVNEYLAAKKTVHATNYKEGPWMLALSTGLEFAFARGVIARIYIERPELPQWHSEVRDIVRKRGVLVNCFGESRQFCEAVAFNSRYGTITDQHWKDAIAWEPQSIPPHIINEACHKIREHLDYVWFHQNMHDSFLASIPWDKLKEFSDFTVPLFNVTLRVNGVDCFIPAVMEAGYNWADLLAYDGSNITRGEWDKATENHRVKRKETIFDGVFGIHLRDWGSL